MSAIEWTEVTWNPTTGCDRVSPGCDHCYALTMAKRLKGMGQDRYQRDGDPRTSGPGFGITEHPDVLTAPLRWRKPRMVFVNSMSDLFHDGVSDDFIAAVWAVMAATPQHTYQILTKRHGRMRSLLSRLDFQGWIHDAVLDTLEFTSDAADWVHRRPWPLDNVWLGVTVEDQRWADIRIPALVQTPAAVRFLSCEPLLGPIDLLGPVKPGGHRPRLTYWLGGGPAWGELKTHPNGMVGQPLIHKPGVDWVIVGGESGPGARPMDLDWARDIVDACRTTGVPVFVKQLGSVWASSGPSRKGGDPELWPADLRVREFPQAATEHRAGYGGGA